MGVQIPPAPKPLQWLGRVGKGGEGALTLANIYLTSHILKIRMEKRWKILIGIIVICFLSLLAVGIYFIIGELVNINKLPIIGGKILVIPIKGEITMEGCSGNIFTGIPRCVKVGDIKEKLKYAESNNEIKAIILDINSPGGGVTASRELMKAVKKTKKPIVARIGEVGTSGAYYVASAADKIVAYKDSITGSIGVIMTLQHYYGLYEKLGINVTVIKAGKSKDIGSPYRPIKDEEKEELKSMVDKIYHDFVSDVAENRNLSYSYVENISDGSIYLGTDAKKLHLIDEIGNMDKAIEIAKKLGKIEGEPDIIKVVPRKRGIFDIFGFNSNFINWIERWGV